MNLMKIILLLISAQLSFAQDSAFDDIESSAVSAKEEYDSQNYIHQGIAQKEYKELCQSEDNKFSDICTEDQYAFDKGGFKTLEVLLPALTKAYALVSGMSGGGKFTAKSMDEKGNQLFTKEGKDVPKGTEGATEKTEQKTDYCSYISMVSEAASTAYMTLRNEKTQSNYESEKPEARQAGAFYATADNQKDMAKAADIQFYVWTGTAGCYAVYASQAQFRGDWKVYAKLGASTFIAYYYKKKADAHKERAKILTEMAKKLPQAGDCNPFTQRACFCNEESSYTVDPTNFNKYCMPAILAARNQANDAYVCADQNAKVDATCECKKTNTCIDRRLVAAGVDLGLGATLMKNPISSLKHLTDGYGSAGINAASAKNLALAKSALKNFKPTESITLSDAEKGLAKDYISAGIPKAAAMYLSKSRTPSNAALPSSLTSVGSSLGSPKGSSAQKLEKLNDVNFKTGNSTRTKSSSANNPFDRFNKKSSTNKASIIVDEYEEKALREAEILKDESQGIFDVISTRYKKRAWVEFQDSFNNTDH